MHKYILFIILSLICTISFEDYAKYNRVRDYDRYFRKYSKRFFGPGFDWRFFKAQAISESGLDKDAVSPAGAKGIMQIMPQTLEEIYAVKPKLARGNHPGWQIAAGIYYNRRLWEKWTAHRPFKDRVNFMFASYNAGFSNIVKAQKHAEIKKMNPNLWSSVTKVLHKVTGKRSRETIFYVKKIHAVKKVLR